MICSEVTPLLELLADEALDAKDSALIVDHLKTCSPCRAEWSQLEDLKQRFRQAAKATPVPDDLLAKIDRRLSAEERDRRKRAPVYALLIGAAAAVLLLFTVPLPFIVHSPASQTATTANADKLVDAVAAEAPEPGVDRASLPERLGYQIVYLNLPDWKLDRAAVHRADSPTAIARFDFVAAKPADGGQRLVCYQAPAGTIRAPGAERTVVAGKNVMLGSRANLQFALWSQNGRDYLFVSPLPRQSLEHLIASV